MSFFFVAGSSPPPSALEYSWLNMVIFFTKFFITTAKCDFLDGKHVVFGKVVDGLLTLRKIENVPTGGNNRPKLTVKITGSSLSFFLSLLFSCAVLGL